MAGFVVIICEIALFALVFFVLQRLTFNLRFPPYERTTIWVPGAVTFSVLLITPLRQWWRYYIGLCVGATAAYYGDFQIPAPAALFAAQFHFAAVAIGVIGIRRYVVEMPFGTVGAMLVFVASAGLVVPLATAVPSEFARWVMGAENLVSSALRSFLCASLGLVIASPAFTTALTSGVGWIRSSSWQRKIEATSLVVSLLVVGQFVFSSPAGAGTLPALIYAPIPLLLWAALRFEVAGASWALLVIAYQSTWNAINHRGPFVGGSADDYVLQMQLFLLAVSLPVLFMAASVYERRRAYIQLIGEIEERRRMEEQFRLVVESTPNAMLMVNQAGEVVLVNKQTQRLFGYREEELLGRSFDELLPLRLRANHATSRQAFFANPQSRLVGSGIESLACRADGSEFPVEIGLTPVETRNGMLVLVAIVDITERKRAEEARQELVHASRLAMLSEFTTSIAHEINQPLGAILSNADAAEMLLELPSPPLDEVRQILVDIREDDLRASNVIRKLRGLLRRSEFERVPIEINSIVADVMVILRAEARRRGVELRSGLAPGLPELMGDKVHLQQVLINLMMNGMEAMTETLGPKLILISTSRNDRFIEVSVSDTGPGIPPQCLPRLFDRFFSTKKEGMGIGLAISRSLVEEHGGRLWVESELGHGATFRFSIPLEWNQANNGEAIEDDSREQYA
ncbi:ATP-binding protein [Pirellulaceae bacterium SH449]